MDENIEIGALEMRSEIRGVATAAFAVLDGEWQVSCRIATLGLISSHVKQLHIPTPRELPLPKSKLNPNRPPASDLAVLITTSSRGVLNPWIDTPTGPFP